MSTYIKVDMFTTLQYSNDFSSSGPAFGPLKRALWSRNVVAPYRPLHPRHTPHSSRTRSPKQLPRCPAHSRCDLQVRCVGITTHRCRNAPAPAQFVFLHFVLPERSFMLSFCSWLHPQGSSLLRLAALVPSTSRVRVRIDGYTVSARGGMLWWRSKPAVWCSRAMTCRWEFRQPSSAPACLLLRSASSFHTKEAHDCYSALLMKLINYNAEYNCSVFTPSWHKRALQLP
jgi:hypothetical protein